MTGDAGRMLRMNRGCAGQRGHDASLRRCALPLIVSAARCAVSTRPRAWACTGESDAAACGACTIMQDGYRRTGRRPPCVRATRTTVRCTLAIDMPRWVRPRGSPSELAWRRGFAPGPMERGAHRVGKVRPAFCADLGHARTVQVRWAGLQCGLPRPTATSALACARSRAQPLANRQAATRLSTGCGMARWPSSMSRMMPMQASPSAL